MRALRRLLLLGFGAATAATGLPAVAGPLPSDVAAVKSAIETGVIDVRWRWVLGLSPGWRRTWFPGGARVDPALGFAWGSFGYPYDTDGIYHPGFALDFEPWRPWYGRGWRHRYYW
jgi:hypothetical protein